MKLFLLFAAAVLVVGVIYRAEVSGYVARVAAGGSGSGGGSAVVESFQGVGNSGNALMGGIGNSLNR